MEERDMEVIYSGNRLRLRWSILRSTSNNAEDFSRAKVYAFAVSCSDVVPLSVVSSDMGVLVLDVPMGLAPDIYAVKAIWWKEGESRHPLHPFYDFGRHGGCVPDVHGGSSGMAMAYRDGLFAVTDVMSEASVPNANAIISFKSHVETYGYDGLSAYEIATIRGKTTLSEDEWLTRGDWSGLRARVEKIESEIKKFHSSADFGKKPYYVGTIGDSTTVFSALAASELLNNATAYYGEERVGTVVNKWTYYIMLPVGVSFKKMYYGSEDLITTIDSVTEFEELHADVELADGTYKVYGMRAQPSSVLYVLEVER